MVFYKNSVFFYGLLSVYFGNESLSIEITQPVFAFWTIAMETLDQCVKSVQN